MVILSGEQMYHQVNKLKKTTLLDETRRRDGTENKTFTVESESIVRFKPECHRFVEMQEIFFNCSIKTNPPVNIVQWYFNGKTLHTDLTKGMFVFRYRTLLII